MIDGGHIVNTTDFYSFAVYNLWKNILEQSEM